MRLKITFTFGDVQAVVSFYVGDMFSIIFTESVGDALAVIN